MTDKSEIDRLNRIGAEILLNGQEPQVFHSRVSFSDFNFSPATDLNHTDLVEQEMSAKGYDWRTWTTGDIFGVRLYYPKREYIPRMCIDREAPLGQKAIAIMRAIEKAWENDNDISLFEEMKPYRDRANALMNGEESEIDRLNKIGAEIMQFKIPLKNGYGYAKDGVWTGFATKKLADEHYVFDDNENKRHPSWWYLVAFNDIWSPATDLNHNAMVFQELVEMGWEWEVENDTYKGEKVITCFVESFQKKHHFETYASTEVLARARAYEKAWEVEK